MKRKTKNILMVFFLILMLGATAFTMYLAKENISGTGNFPGNQQAMEPMGSSDNLQPPTDMQNGENDQSQDQITPTQPDGQGDQGQGQEPPAKPDGQSDQSQGQEPPAKPDGQSDQSQGQEPPAKPDGQSNQNQGQEPPANPDGQMQQGGFQPAKSLTAMYYIAFGLESVIFSLLLIYLLMSKFNKKSFKETLTSPGKIAILILLSLILATGLTFADKGITENFLLGNNGPAQGMNMGGQTSDISYSAKEEITQDKELTEGTYSSENSDENAIMADGNINVSLSGIKVSKTGDSDGGDNTSFYGTNSAVIAKNGANLSISNIQVSTSATGANGVFCYGGSATTNNSASDGTSITISDSKITTTKDNSGGIMTTGGGKMTAKNLEINTAGTSSAAIRSDRGGGTVSVDGGSYTTTGKGSPAVYSTADISVSNANLISKASEGIIIEGKNSVSIENTTLTDNNTELNGLSSTYKNIFLYQSMSGDADNGTAEFSAKNSTITTKKGDTFYVTNTTATIDLVNNKIINSDSTGNFLRIQKDSWGNSGSNGGDVTLNMTNQDAMGNIVVDSISTLTTNMKSSYFKGMINTDNSAKSIKLVLDKDSKIVLTGDSYVTSLDDADSSYSNIDFNGFKLYVGGDELTK